VTSSHGEGCAPARPSGLALYRRFWLKTLALIVLRKEQRSWELQAFPGAARKQIPISQLNGVFGRLASAGQAIGRLNGGRVRKSVNTRGQTAAGFDSRLPRH